jgi:hypothetical protein
MVFFPRLPPPVNSRVNARIRNAFPGVNTP